MKYLHEKYPFTFGVIFFIIYFALDFIDARFFIPRKIAEARQCELDDKCRTWINIHTEDGVHGAHTVLKTAPPKG
jgi:hypothetical protein